MRSLLQFASLAAFSGLVLMGCSTTTTTQEKSKFVKMHAVSAQGIGKELGTVELRNNAAGLVIHTQLQQLPAGERGFHIHEKGSCAAAEKDGKMVAALAAGGHFNPKNVPHHGTPLTGHLGDLPALSVASDGTAKVTVIAPRLTLAQVEGLALMIHAGGDNYADHPKPLGGGGERIACGII